MINRDVMDMFETSARRLNKSRHISQTPFRHFGAKVAKAP